MNTGRTIETSGVVGETDSDGMTRYYDSPYAESQTEVNELQHP